jgi:hypothetical protein
MVDTRKPRCFTSRLFLCTEIFAGGLTYPYADIRLGLDCGLLYSNKWSSFPSLLIQRE